MANTDMKRILENVGSFLIYGGTVRNAISICNVRFLSREPTTIQECERIFISRQWRTALRCYESTLAAGAQSCLVFLRIARILLLVEKPNTTSTLHYLSEALNRVQGDDEQECRAWAEKTVGDVYYRQKEYGEAAQHYENALKYRSISREVSAVIHSDCGAAKLMAGDNYGAQRHNRIAAETFSDLIAHHILGTMGTVQYGEDARVIIEKSLKLNHEKTLSLASSEWHRKIHALETTRQGALFEVRGPEALDHPCTRGERAKSISLFCRLRGQTPGTAEQVWGPSSIEKGVGGSEEAAIYLSRQLAALGYCVRVYGNPPMEEWGTDEHGVVWLPFYAYRSDLAPDAFISWRNFDAVWLGAGARRRYIWVHDPLALASDQDYFVRPFLDAVDGIFVLSKHSATQFPRHVQRKLILTSNGLAPHLILDGRNDHCQLLYSSWPSSGLELILEVWPEVVRRAPCAVLNVYYGFDMWWATALYRHDPGFIQWRRRMEALLEQPGVRYHGMVGHARMAEAYAENGFYVYPTDTPETAPINLMKAQANGCVPITSRLPASAIPETCGRFDLGPPPPPGRTGSIRGDSEWTAAWTERVVRAVLTPHAELERHRREMKAYARQRYNWTRVALDWQEALGSAGRLLSPALR